MNNLFVSNISNKFFYNVIAFLKLKHLIRKEIKQKLISLNSTLFQPQFIAKVIFVNNISVTQYQKLCTKLAYTEPNVN